MAFNCFPAASLALQTSVALVSVRSRICNSLFRVVWGPRERRQQFGLGSLTLRRRRSRTIERAVECRQGKRRIARRFFGLGGWKRDGRMSHSRFQCKTDRTPLQWVQLSTMVGWRELHLLAIHRKHRYRYRSGKRQHAFPDWRRSWGPIRRYTHSVRTVLWTVSNVGDITPTHFERVRCAQVL